jgi:hypothetical protein
MKSTISLASAGFQDVPLAELSSVEGGGKIAFTLGRIGISPSATQSVATRVVRSAGLSAMPSAKSSKASSVL